MAHKAREIEAALQRAAVAVRDPVPGVLESDGRHDRHTGYGGSGPGVTSVNPHKQGSGAEVVPMFPGNNSG